MPDFQEDEMFDLDELERLAKAASPGPWRYSRHVAMVLQGAPGSKFLAVVAAGSDEDREYIAASNPRTVLELIARIRADEVRIIALEERLIPLINEQLKERLRQIPGVLAVQ